MLCKFYGLPHLSINRKPLKFRHLETPQSMIDRGEKNAWNFSKIIFRDRKKKMTFNKRNASITHQIGIRLNHVSSIGGILNKEREKKKSEIIKFTDSIFLWL